MKANTRFCIAYIAGSLINKKSYSSLIDHSDNRIIKITGKFDRSNIDLHVHDDDSNVVGMIKGNEMSIYHSLENSTVRMKIDGLNFKGHDAGTDKDFIGSVTGKTVKIYDYSEYQSYFFALGE